MKDVDLDALIQQDKKKEHRHNRNRPRGRDDRRGGRRLIGRGQGASRVPGKFNRDRQDRRRPINKDRKGSRDHSDKPRRLNRFNDRNRRGDRPKQSEGKREQENKSKQHKNPKQQAPKQQKGRTLKVLGLHPDITNQDLYKLFAAEGALEKCMIERDNFGRDLPSAIVKYYTAENAKKAMEKLNDQKVLNSVLKVEPYKNIRK